MRRTTLLALSLALVIGLVAPADAAVAEQQVLVRFADGVTRAQASRVLSAAGAVRVGSVYGDDVAIVRGRGVFPRTLVRVLSASRLVDYAEPDAVYRLFVSEPDDARLGSQYALQRIQAVGGWSAYPGTYETNGGPTIAVIDTGIDRDHEDLVAKTHTVSSRCFGLCLLGGYNDDNGHGTHTAGIAAAATNNGKGIAGVAVGSKVMALKVCNLLGSCSLSDVTSAVNWARDKDAKVISMSLGGTTDSTTLRNAIERAHAAGIVIVAAAGNDGDARANFPAAYPQVISVAATDSADERASFSNTHETVELSAPGVGVVSAWNSGGYRSVSGTSMSAPHVAGLAALLLGQNPGWSGEDVRARMRDCADDLGEPGWDAQFGHGRINMARALGEC